MIFKYVFIIIGRLQKDTVERQLPELSGDKGGSDNLKFG
jgi:hypothetical protein